MLYVAKKTGILTSGVNVHSTKKAVHQVVGQTWHQPKSECRADFNTWSIRSIQQTYNVTTTSMNNAPVLQTTKKPIMAASNGFSFPTTAS